MIFQALYDQMDFSSWVLLGFALLILLDVVKNWRRNDYPPGPLAVPLLGNVFTGTDCETLEKLTQKYGPVFSLRRGSERMVFISGYKMVKEALVNQLDSFVDRPVVPLFHVIFKGIGIAMSNGYLWKKQRKFANTHLRYFGEGQKSLEKYLEVECNFICEAFKEKQGPHQTIHANYYKILNFLKLEIEKHQEEWNPDDPRDFIDVYLGEIEKAGFNIDSLLVAILDLIEAGTETAATTLRWAILFMMHYPEIQGPPALPVLGNIFSIESKQPHIYLTKLADVYGNVFCIRLGRNKTVFVSGWKMVKEALVTQAENFVDRPYSPMVSRIYSGNSGGLFFSNGKVWRRQRRFAMAMLRTFGLARSSMEQTICEESRHLQEEMKKKEGPHNGIFSSSKSLKASIRREIERHKLDLDPSNPRDYIDKFLVEEKGTAVMPNLTSVLFDKNEWETPDVFNPEHFLDADGKFVRKEAFLPFSAGNNHS
ncbi:unnamed protein product [Menidia menidia]|uniref:(Atlantic silverside) hypothetical protein n=1 Tax=Menidia menidia TaxID=238744 RepID=A0A8S4A8P8_9TELE|nr:unnamed protein product [Menidia menidia]